MAPGAGGPSVFVNVIAEIDAAVGFPDAHTAFIEPGSLELPPRIIGIGKLRLAVRHAGIDRRHRRETAQHQSQLHAAGNQAPESPAGERALRASLYS